ncbi:cytosolic endo-beta-N-acetylglucosaminidase-like [Lineus longissimus]|uniref:cytosolic endo-beta-N-acetylglucosaminidase-like n=1 Tax=Lineus longissimus TaxID=88925 RepID=UPI002B4CD6C2
MTAPCEQTMHLPQFCYDQETGEPVCQPLKTLEKLLQWTPNKDTEHGKAVVHLQTCTPKQPNSPRTTLCHDMKGGYLEDRFVNGVQQADPYRFYHWQYIDSFIYFSHSFITIPPCGWTNAAHRHGVQMMGTLITEWDDGYKLCHKFLESLDILNQVIDQMVKIAKYYNFEGWLVNIENKIEKEQVPKLIEFVKRLTEKMHAEIPNSTVLWYDSVTIHGNLKWQDQLNDLNKAYFDVCDGIFLNYGWKDKGLESSAKMAVDAGRPVDVYVGVDVFGRSGFKGGYDVKEALDAVNKHNMSIALFAQGWVYETQGVENFMENENRFWENIRNCFHVHGPTSLPLSTSFCQGFGRKYYMEGKVEEEAAWHNLTKQELQPTFLNSQFKSPASSCKGNQCMRLCNSDAYKGGGCLELTGTPQGDVLCYRLFSALIQIPGPLKIEYVYKITAGKRVDLFMEMQIFVDDAESLLIVRGLSASEKDGVQEKVSCHGKEYVAGEKCVNGWCKRSVIIKEESLLGAAIVGLNFGCVSKTEEPFKILIGELQIAEA